MALDATLGVTRLGHYRLVRRLAVGGMAELFVAVAQGAGEFAKPVAIKRILPRLAAEEHFVEMFFEEARLAASLDHPHIAKVLDFGEEGGLPYIVMELVHGVDLGVLLRAIGGPLPTEIALTVLVQLAEALHHVHEQRDLRTGKPLGLVHRDVSPSNVLVGYSGGVKLTDFGIVKATSATQYTATGALKGKLSYLAPEQARCERLDRRTDVYALGLVMYELFTGRRMHRAMSEVALLARVCDGEYTPPSAIREDLDPEIEAIIARALMADPETRFATARELGNAVEALATRRGWSLSMGRLSDFLDGLLPNPGPITVDRSVSQAFETEVSSPTSTRTLGQAVKARGRSIAVVSALLGVGIGAALGPQLFGRDDAPTPAAPQPAAVGAAPASAPTPAAATPDSGVKAEPEVAPEPAVELETPPEPASPKRKKRRRSKSSKKKKKASSLDAKLLPPSQR